MHWSRREPQRRLRLSLQPEHLRRDERDRAEPLNSNNQAEIGYKDTSRVSPEALL